MPDDEQTGEEEPGDGASGDLEGGAPAVLTDEHRNAIGELLQQAADRTGLPISDFMGQVGLNTADVNELTHGDLLQAAQYLMQNHPELVQEVAGRIPALQGLLGLIGAGGGQQGGSGLLGGLLGRVLGGS